MHHRDGLYLSSAWPDFSGGVAVLQRRAYPRGEDRRPGHVLPQLSGRRVEEGGRLWAGHPHQCVRCGRLPLCEAVVWPGGCQVSC